MLAHAVNNLLNLGAVLAFSISLWTLAPAQDQQKPRTKTDRESCLVDKDHLACKKYYRIGCLNKDADACGNYAKERMVDCGQQPGPGSPSDKIYNYLACSRKAQCWKDRAIAIAQIDAVCTSDPNSVQCKEARDRFASVSVGSCDGTSVAGPPNF